MQEAAALDEPPAPASAAVAGLVGATRLPARDDGRRRAEGGLRLSDPGRCRHGAPGRPLVSYVTVVRNARATLARTLASVRAQRWGAVEHIVVDGLSGDGTLEVIEAHAGQIDYYVSEPDGGLYEALNKALTLVRGSLVCVLNADDWLAPDAAAVAARALLRLERDAVRPGPRLILSSAWLHNGRRRRLWLPGPLDAGSWLRCPNICHNGVYATPAALAAAGPYDTRLRIVADSRWLLGALDAGVAISYCAAPTVHYVTGGLSGDVTRHVEDCARLVALRFPALSEAEVWTLLHAFYPWTGNLAPFADRYPANLGRALQHLAARHAGDAALRASLQAAGLARQIGHARRVRTRKPLVVNLQRGLWRAWHGLRQAWQR
ncbi:MAG: hypothetical protein ABT20_16895 [Rubrivivax sp. SCN 70-15]|nr:MAG: hypothetical protein ABT20_16895 [Rubrivivax sp. SCN 70-15]